MFWPFLFYSHSYFNHFKKILFYTWYVYLSKKNCVNKKMLKMHLTFEGHYSEPWLHVVSNKSRDWCSYAATWSDKNKDKDQKGSWSTTNQLPSSRDYLGDFLVWRPPIGLGKSQAFWLGLTLWLGLVGAALLLQKWHSFKCK